MSEQHTAEKDAPCGWCHHPINSKPPFDCRNPMHAERTAENDAPVARALRQAAELMREAWDEPAREAVRLKEQGQPVGTMAPTMLAVADLLDDIAETRELVDSREIPFEMSSHLAYKKARAVALAYLGESS